MSVRWLRSETGTRAKDWLEREMGRVSFNEDALGQEFVAALELGLNKERTEWLGVPARDTG